MVDASQPRFDRERSGPAFAALDLGTNNCRLLIGAPDGSGFRVLDSFSRIVRLGEGLHGSGRLNSLAMDRAIIALQACSVRMARRPIRAVRVTTAGTYGARMMTNAATAHRGCRCCTSLDLSRLGY